MRRMNGKWVSENEYNVLKVTNNDLYIESLNCGFHSMEERETLFNSDNDYEYDNVCNSADFQGFIYESDIMVIAKTSKAIWFVVGENENQFVVCEDGLKIYDDIKNNTDMIIENHFNNEDIIFQDQEYINNLLDGIIDNEYFGIVYEDTMNGEIQVSKFYIIA